MRYLNYTFNDNYYYYYVYILDQSRLRGFYIQIDGRECYRRPNLNAPPTIFVVDCNQNGQVVTFKLPDNNNDVLTLCEIEVYGKATIITFQ